MNLDKHKMVDDFHQTYKIFRNNKPALPDDTSLRELRKDLLKEEFEEYLEGEKNNDLVEIADALGDMIYIIYGTAITYGIPLDAIFNEIHSSNMSKLGPDGNPIYREDGKVMKGPGYFKPNIKKYLE